MEGYSRDLSWRERCSLLLKAREQYEHRYFLSGVDDAFLAGVLEAAGAAVAGIFGWVQERVVESTSGKRCYLLLSIHGSNKSDIEPAEIQIMNGGQDLHQQCFSLHAVSLSVSGITLFGP